MRTAHLQSNPWAWESKQVRAAHQKLETNARVKSLNEDGALTRTRGRLAHSLWSFKACKCLQGPTTRLIQLICSCLQLQSFCQGSSSADASVEYESVSFFSMVYRLPSLLNSRQTQKGQKTLTSSIDNKLGNSHQVGKT